MKWRISGCGECWYELGIEDDGSLVGLKRDDFIQSLTFLKQMVSMNDANIVTVNEFCKNDNYFAEIFIAKNVNSNVEEVKIAVLGDSGAGKSSLLSVLGSNDLDDSNGKARLSLLKHRHEILSGKTSSVIFKRISFDSEGKVLNNLEHSESAFWEKEMGCENSAKWVTLIDVAGYSKYLRTTLSSLTLVHLDYVFIVIDGSSDRLESNALDHLELGLSLDVPAIIIVNKVDLTNQQRIFTLFSQFITLLSQRSLKLGIIDSPTKFPESFTNFIPVFMTSCCTGHSIELLRSYIFSLKCRPIDLQNEFQAIINDVFFLPVGIVAQVSVKSGYFNAASNPNLNVGPDSLGSFVQCQVSSIHRYRNPVEKTSQGDIVTMVLECKDSSLIRKGAIVTTSDCLKGSFGAHISCRLLSSSKMPKLNQRVILILRGRTVMAIVKDIVLNSDEVMLSVKFVKFKEIINAKERIIIWNCGIKAVGSVVE